MPVREVTCPHCGEPVGTRLLEQRVNTASGGLVVVVACSACARALGVVPAKQ